MCAKAYEARLVAQLQWRLYNCADSFPKLHFRIFYALPKATRECFATLAMTWAAVRCWLLDLLNSDGQLINWGKLLKRNALARFFFEIQHHFSESVCAGWWTLAEMFCEEDWRKLLSWRVAFAKLWASLSQRMYGRPPDWHFLETMHYALGL